MSYFELDRFARTIGGLLQGFGAEGARALLLYPPGLEFIEAFFGCLYGGAIAVPAYPPRLGRDQARLRGIVRDARPSVVLTTASLAGDDLLKAELPELRDALWLATDHLEGVSAAPWEEPSLSGDSLAFLQYTSGSTAAPKGVMVSHGNLLHNQEAIRRAFGQTAESVIVGWLPMYHDMGLIGNVLQPLYLGARCVLMSPAAFLQKPVRWLRAITRYRATTSGGPNFAYELCARRVGKEDLADLDLGSWRVAFNGAEPVRAETLERFTAAFAQVGFRAEAFFPCYGLAEATLFVAGQPGATVESFDAKALEQDRAAASPAFDPCGARLVGCGPAAEGLSIAIVDPESRALCPPGRIAEIWVSGPGVAGGYWGRPEETEETFRATLAGDAGRFFLRTGDLGTFHGGELFVTGRLKDLIIIRGRNLYPQDIERTVESSHPALQPGGGAAFSVEVEGEERLVVVHELTRHGQRGEKNEIFEAVRRAVTEEHEVQTHDIVLLASGSLPRTTSGKVRRGACRAGYLEGSLAIVARSASLAPQPATAALPRRSELLALSGPERRSVLTAALHALLVRLTGVALPGSGLETSLAALGLDSVAVIELGASLEAALGVDLSAAELLRMRSLAELVGLLSARLEAELESAAPTVAARERELPLSYGQIGLWLLDRSAPERAVLNLGGAARTRAEVDAEALRRALARLASRHAPLRTGFVDVSGEPRQRIGEAADIELVEIDATSWSQDRLGAWYEEELYRPFDLERGPLLRAWLVETSQEERVLALSVHHLVADLWSLTLLVQELSALYDEEAAGAPASLPPLAHDYGDYVLWQREMLAGEEGDRLWGYWRERLAPPLPVLDLPADQPRTAASWRAGAEPLVCSPELSERLRSLARSQDATLYMVLLGGFLALLHRLTGEKDLLVGSPAAGRSPGWTAPLLGYFVNPVPLRVDASGDPNFSDFLGRVREVSLAAFEHQGFPMQLAAERLRLSGDAGRLSLFRAVFALQRAQVPALGALGSFVLGAGGARLPFGPLTLEPLPLPARRVQFDLSLVVAEVQGRIEASFQYAADLFDPATVVRMAGAYKRLLSAIAGSGGFLSELPLLSESERQQALREWNDTSGEVEPACVHERVAAQAARRPDDPALVHRGHVLTYGELLSRARRLAQRLRDLGIEAEDRVGVLLPRSADLVVSELAVLWAGGAYVPLEPESPAERLGWMLSDSGARALITRGAQPELAGLAVVDLESEVERLSRPPEAQMVRADGAGLAYVIYTSGSTGRPKGVGVTHAGLAGLVSWHLSTYGVGGGDRMTLVASPGFDASVWEIWPALAAGASLHVPDEEVRTSPRALVEWLAREGITSSFLPTPLAEAVLGEPWPEETSLRVLLTGGDRLRQPPAAGLPFALVNHYGPTEDTVVSTAGRVEPQGSGLPPIGRPIQGGRAYVVGGWGEPLPVGAVGELWLGGTGLARGYLGRPELTAERFVPDGLSAEPGSRLYRTGDLVRRRVDGGLEFMGRRDDQVKVRGFRVELGEIEEVLSQQPGVRESAVVAVPTARGDRELVGFMASGGTVSFSELRSALGSRLPSYMVPSRWVELASLPVSVRGKVDRAALERLAPESPVPSGRPRTAVEELLSGIWSELLGVEGAGPESSFFDLGGHSLLAMRLVARVREVLGAELSVREVFESPTLSGLASRIEFSLGRGAEPWSALERVDRAGELPLSFAQERLWFLDRLSPDSAVYNLPAALELRGEVSEGRLAAALSEVSRRHETLRTRFEVAAGRPVQVIESTPRPGLSVVDLSVCPEGLRGRELERLMEEEAARAFDLERGPLARASLVRLEPGRSVLLLTLHHIIADGWSMGVLARELGELYAALSEGRRPSLPELAVQYVDLAVWQRRWLSGAVLEGLLATWRERLSGAPPVLELPADRPRPLVASFRGARVGVALPAATGEELRETARRLGATAYMVLLSAFEALLSGWTGQEDLLVGSPVANRTRLESEALIGLFANTVVLRGDVSGDPEFTELVRRTRSDALGAYAAQDLPFERLVEGLGLERDLSRNPLVQVMLALQNAPAADLVLSGLEPRLLETVAGVSRLDVSLTLSERGGGYAGFLEYSTDLFDRTTAERLVRGFTTLLSGALSRPGLRISELPLLSESERQQALREWNDTSGEVEPACVHERVAAQAARRPDDPALVHRGHVLTYGELEQRANRLAHRLRRLGVATGDRIGVCVERSLEMVVALLATLKAGAAYIPLDPSYPEARLAGMLEDGGAAVLLAHSGALAARLSAGRTALLLDLEAPSLAEESAAPLPPAATLEDLAYVIFTSGSTGRPKGVMVSHRNLASFFAAMEDLFGAERPGTWLAVTSISFDISVLELLWTLARGSEVVIQDEPRAALRAATTSTRPIDFSLFYFADVGAAPGDRYRLLIEGAKFADAHGFKAVWTPERHFHSFGGLYPNPSVTGAAIAVVTRRIEVRAGSVVLPLHDPLRVAEEWSVVDNLSGGRAAISFASGWHADDFVLAPDHYAVRKEFMLRDIEVVRRLWRGEAVRRRNGVGQEIEIRVQPQPVQPELPFWLTAAGSTETFRIAGEIGANVLTHLLGQSIEEVAERIAVYRRAWRQAGHAGEGVVSLMLHTFVGRDEEAVRARVRGPLTEYLRSSFGLVDRLARSLGYGEDASRLSPADMDALLAHAFDRYYATSGLLGTPETCRRMLERLRAIEVDEVACLIDFGLEVEAVLAGLGELAELQREAAMEQAGSVPAQIARHQVSELQCTPSLATALIADAAGLAALRPLRRLLLGGEALPASLAGHLDGALDGEVLNMYGPTETTVWSLSRRLRPGERRIPIGRPILNTEAHLLDRRLRPVPLGVPGEIFLGGQGVTPGYWRRPDLTAERFIPDALSGRPGARLYRTGDLGRRRVDGEIEFLGRLDLQVKVRGHRIELGEVEAALGDIPGVREAVVVAREDAGQPRLVAYLCAADGQDAASGPLAPRGELQADRAAFTLPNGMPVASLSHFQTNTGYREIFEDEVYLRHGISLPPDACVFDIGANIGLFTLFVHTRCAHPRIFAFEPLPPTFETLAANVALYGLDVRLFHAGLADHPGQAEFTFYPRAPGLSGRFAGSAEDREETRAIVLDWLSGVAAPHGGPALSPGQLEEVLDEHLESRAFTCALTTVSEVIHEHGVERIDLLKVDAERSEWDVLAGICDDDWSKIDQIVLEVHTRSLLDRISALLAAKGFELAVEDVAVVEPGPDRQGVAVHMLYAVARERVRAGRSTRALSATELRSRLAERLPEHMIPEIFVTLPALPLTSNGKVDRRALPAPATARPRLESAYVAPRTERESAVAGIWREVLGRDRVGIHDNFFEVGGNSLSLVQVHGRLREVLGRDITLVQLFRNPTIHLLARALDAAEASAEAPALAAADNRAKLKAEAMRDGEASQRRKQFLDARRRRAPGPSRT